MKTFDVLIIGSGAAGQCLALQINEQLSVGIISKGAFHEGSTYYAQGGISAVLGKNDSIESHIADTLAAGAGLCDPDVVRYAVENGKASIEWLIKLGVPFTPSPSADNECNYHLTQEGGHSHRRVIHAADTTGQAIQKTLEQHIRERKNITLLEQHIAVDLIMQQPSAEKSHCIGAYVLNRNNNKVTSIAAKYVALATGGANKAYLYTSNPDVSTGDGIAMAWRAGCRVSNLEFVQFHPTCLYHPDAKSFLISETLRGEGGKLLLPDGSSFMGNFDKREELAPRDIVARAIDHEMKRLGIDHVLLDISFKDPAFIRQHFPNIYKKCLEFGYDITKQAIPVVPAAHYTCGGIVTNIHGQTDIKNLYAIGEIACTGMHGANRMASNSLLECLVFAHAAAKSINKSLTETQATPPHSVPLWDASRVTKSNEKVVVSHDWDELRRFMWNYVGIVRTTKRLQRASNRIQLLQKEIDDYYAHCDISSDFIELRNLALVSELIIRCAMTRKESRGLHYTLDYPQRNDEKTPENTVLIPPSFRRDPDLNNGA